MTYRHDQKVAPLVRQLPWSHHLVILGRCKRPEEREFYTLLDAVGQDGIDLLGARFSGFDHYATIIYNLAAGIASGEIKAPD